MLNDCTPLAPESHDRTRDNKRYATPAEQHIRSEKDICVTGNAKAKGAESEVSRSRVSAALEETVPVKKTKKKGKKGTVANTDSPFKLL